MEKASNSLKVQKKKQNIEDEAKSENSEENKPKKKYIVFLGNLPFDITKEEIEDHFKSIKTRGQIISIRLLTDKKTNQPRGCAFIEFDNSLAMNIALKMHHTILKDRKINVEISVGAGGNTEKRKEKIKEKNKLLRKQRKQFFKKKVQPQKLQKLVNQEATEKDSQETTSQKASDSKSINDKKRKRSSSKKVGNKNKKLKVKESN